MAIFRDPSRERNGEVKHERQWLYYIMYCIYELVLSDIFAVFTHSYACLPLFIYDIVKSFLVLVWETKRGEKESERIDECQ